MSAQPIVYWDRRAKRLAEEAIYGESFMRWFYETRMGQTLAGAVLTRKPFSRLYGAYQGSSLSRTKIPRFIRDFSIPMEEYVDDGYRSFNDFFIRRFRPGARNFETQAGRMPAFAEGKVVAYASTAEGQRFAVKGSQVRAEGLLGGREPWATRFKGGPMIISRLCPTDYHRYHYPDDGRTLEHYTVEGPLHSVSPIALQFKNDILFTNERRVAILETRSFGALAYVEVGAICVGRIVQSHDESRPFARGDEKGYFLFGGSTVIVFGEPGKWTPEADLLDQTAQGRETYVRLGESLARAI